MIVLDARFHDVTRDPDFGRVEAVVTLKIKRRGEPARAVRVRTNVADRGSRPLRERLAQDAARMSAYFLDRESGSFDRVA